MNEQYKDHPFNGATYQIGRLSALDGTWILGRWTEKWNERQIKFALSSTPQAEPAQDDAAQDPQMPTQEQASLAMAGFLIPKLTREELTSVQNICLARCSRYEDVGGRPVPMPVMAGPGRWAVAELEFDGPAVLELLRQSIAFNIAPFFPAPGSS